MSWESHAIEQKHFFVDKPGFLTPRKVPFV